MNIIHNQTELPLEALVSQTLPEATTDVIKTTPATLNMDLAAMLFGANSEVCVDLEKSTKQFAVALYKDGIWEKRENPIGSFIFKRTSIEVPFATNTIQPAFKMKIGKIPTGVLKATAKFFRLIMKDMSNSESMVQIFWDTQDKKYFIHVPEQYVAGASIRFLHTQEIQNDSRYVWVIDIHSHNTMGAFFSGGDDRDEKSTRIFGVLGQLQNDEYASKWRAGCNGKYYDLKLEDIFSDEDAAEFEVLEEDVKKVRPYSAMPDSLKSCVVSVGGMPVQTVIPGGNRTPTYTPGMPYQSTGGWQNFQRQRRLERQYMDRDDDNILDRGRRVIAPQYGRNTDRMYSNYKVDLDFSGDNITHSAYKAGVNLISGIQDRLKEGPVILIDPKDNRYDGHSPFLLEVLEETLGQLNGELWKDLKECEFSDDLSDICVFFVGILMQFPKNRSKYLNIMAHEIDKIKNSIEAESDHE